MKPWKKNGGSAPVVDMSRMRSIPTPTPLAKAQPTKDDRPPKQKTVLSSTDSFVVTAGKILSQVEAERKRWALNMVFEALAAVTPLASMESLKAAFAEWMEKSPQKKPSHKQRSRWSPTILQCAWPSCHLYPTVKKEGDVLTFCSKHAARESEQAEYFDQWRQTIRMRLAIREQDSLNCRHCDGTGRVPREETENVPEHPSVPV
jgi:hypothetical protein